MKPLKLVPPSLKEAEVLSIVVVDDNRDDAELIGLALSDAGMVFDMVVVENEAGLRQALAAGPDLVLCDYNLPQFSPQAALALIGALTLPVPLIVVTRAIGEQAAVEVLRRGARDYVQKNHLATLPEVIRRVLREQAAEFAVEAARARLAAANARLRELGERLLGAQERERSRVARELHDVLGQSLTSALMHLEAADRVEDPAMALNYRSTVRTVLLEVLDEVRTLSFTLQPPQIELFGLAAALDSSVELLLRPLGIVTRIRVRGDLRGIPDTQAAVLYRVVLEAVANTVRHAHASRVLIQLSRLSRLSRLSGDKASYSATVLDDGVGFDPVEVLAREALRAPLGLNSMIERCELVGGRLRIRSRPDRGTLVHARV
jgi:signal transduction histidine kinase